jgi:4-amino-4-deoxy-L-arabinose transferase-like glycosyltransferase
MTDLAVQTAPPTKTNSLIITISRVLMVVALLILLGYLLVYAAFAVNLMQFPFDYDQGEGFELVDTIMFSEGRLPYQDTNVYPFYSSNYPPLFHVMAAPFVWLFGEAYWYGRLLGFLGTLVAAAAIGVAVYREGGHKWIAVLSGLAFLASNTIYHIGPLFRQHMTMVMFETLAVVVLANVNEIQDTRKRRITLAVGLGLILAAGYTKQLALATAVAVFVFLFIRQPRRAVIWGIVFALVGSGIFLWLNRATNGQWWLQTISANVNDYIPDQTFGLYRLWFSLHGFLIVPAVLYALYELYFARLSLYTIWFAAAVANAALSGKWGAGDSYFATSIAALCILSGICFSRLVRGNWSFAPSFYTRWLIQPFRRIAPVVVAASLIIVPLCYIGYGRAVLHMPTQGAIFEPIATALGLEANADNGFYDSAGRIAGGYANIGHFTTQADIEEGWRIVDLVRQADGDVLSEEAAFNLLAGKTVITNPTQILNLSLNNQFDSTALIDMLERQEFGLVILRALFYPRDVIDAIYENYEQTETIHMNGFDYMILTPIQAE